MVPFLHRAAPATMEDNPLWLVVLADMMTNLMLFFLVLFALTRQSQQARRRFERVFAAEEIIDRSAPAEAAPGYRERASIAALSSLFNDVSVTERQVRVRLKDRLLFKSGEAALAPDSERTLQVLATVLAQMPNTVVVEGHTDDVPIHRGPYRTNWELSVARSHAVIERLVSGGLPPARLVTSGYGPYHPLAPGGAAAARARNRRVEIVILRAGEDSNE